jgi:tRNA-splicing ligase RtcB (3'-phosphate/5'-hydroxy nucleic acid ligase)
MVDTSIGNVKLWIPKEKIEESALKQIEETSKHPRLFKHVAIMPDVHAGIGCTIGSVIPLKDAVMPSAVGVDIGCGMCACQTDLLRNEVEPHFDRIYEAIREKIPMGFKHRSADHMANEIFKKMIESCPLPNYEEKFPKKPILPQLGTLGGGNHFIELQVDHNDKVWVMIHSGSRNIGLTIANYHMKKAKEVCKDAPKDMEYFDTSTEEAKNYIRDMNFALDFAKLNRLIMMEIILDELLKIKDYIFLGNPIDIHHNYVENEAHFGERTWVHRKGATKADTVGFGIIPGSMGTSSYIVQGKANPDSFHSCSHGAGRLMSRTKARGKINYKTGEIKSEGVLNVDDFQKDMEGVYTRSINKRHLDEAPRAYKNIDEVMDHQKDLVNIVYELKPIFNMKG